MFPGKLQIKWIAELRLTENGFTLKTALPTNMHFGIVRANFATRRVTLSDYDAYDGNEQFMATAELAAQQVEEIKQLLDSLTLRAG